MKTWLPPFLRHLIPRFFVTVSITTRPLYSCIASARQCLLSSHWISSIVGWVVLQVGLVIIVSLSVKYRNTRSSQSNYSVYLCVNLHISCPIQQLSDIVLRYAVGEVGSVFYWHQFVVDSTRRSTVEASIGQTVDLYQYWLF